LISREIGAHRLFGIVVTEPSFEARARNFHHRPLRKGGRRLARFFARLMRFRRKPLAPVAELESHASDYRAVSIVPTTASCREARRLRGARFLLGEAPRLPLPQCTQRLTCSCHYRKFPDRRVIERRDIASSGRWFMGDDRRKSSGRRATDHHLSRIDITWSQRE
jgi:hypothetical protein